MAIKTPKVDCDYCTEDVSKRKSPLKWLGNKSWLVQTLHPFWHNYKLTYDRKDHRLVEPFCGSATVSVSLNPGRALLNDDNYHLINFHKWVKHDGLTLDIDLENNQFKYYLHRKRFNELITDFELRSMDGREAAQIFYYLNRTCFRGVCRFNRTGQFNVPYGHDKNASYKQDFLELQQQYANWNFRSKDFEALKIKPTDFIYADPPYDGKSSAFTAYTVEGFTWHDQVRLANWLSNHSGPVIASNLATPRIMKLYSSLGFKIKVLPAPRRVGVGSAERSVNEVLMGKNY